MVFRTCDATACGAQDAGLLIAAGLPTSASPIGASKTTILSPTGSSTLTLSSVGSKAVATPSPASEPFGPGRWPSLLYSGFPVRPRRAPSVGDSGKDWTPSRLCGTKGASLLLRRCHPVPYFSGTTTGVPELFLSRPPTPTASLEPLNSSIEGENGRGMITEKVATAGRPATTPRRDPTFPQK